MSDHPWCRDVPRDLAVRASEDAAAVPSIQHRDLPAAVEELRERVAELEAAAKLKPAANAGGESNQEPPRWWLTAEERRAIVAAVAVLDQRGRTNLNALLARSTPPRVRRPNPNVVATTTGARDLLWIAAIREAGGEVEE